jgi:ABC-2 type transport system permease protein
MSVSMNLSNGVSRSQLANVILVARNEFARVLAHPLTPLIVLVLAFYSVLNGIGGTLNMNTSTPAESGLYYSIGQNFMYTAVYCAIVALFIGVTSIAEERRNNAINILLAKPLYRRDVIAGKVLGLNIYMLCVIVFGMTLAAVMLAVFYMPPSDPVLFLGRLAIYILLLFVYSSLNIAISMLVGIIIKDLLLAASTVMAYIFLDWYTSVLNLMPGFDNFDPQIALCHLYINGMTNMQSTTLQIGQWLNANIANLAFFIMSIIIVILIGLVAYTREENL